jgi:hypothetical protein
MPTKGHFETPESKAGKLLKYESDNPTDVRKGNFS